MKFLLVAALLLPAIIAVPVSAIEQSNSYTIAQAALGQAENKAAVTTPVAAEDEEEEEESEGEAANAQKKAAPSAATARKSS